MIKRSYITVALSSLFCVSAALGYDVNKDLTNLGPDAKDLAVSLSGTEDVTAHFDGYTSGANQGHFGSFSEGPVGDNTDMHWQDFDDGTDDTIDTGQKIHIGWSTADHSSKVRDMWWTDATGARIPGSVVYNITSDWTYESSKEVAKAGWNNDFDPAMGGTQTVTISDVEYAVLTTAVALAELNDENVSLAKQLLPLPGGKSFPVPSGEGVTLTIPGTVPEGSAVVLRYAVSAPGSTAQSLDFVQFIATPSIPTVSEWGLAVMTLLVLTAGTVLVGRRRRRAAA